jgi:cystathionine beta-lyase/cystathionine gamma-synthase
MIALADELKPGDRVVFTQDAYHGFLVYAREELPKRGVRVDFIDFTDLAAVKRAIPGAALAWVETPTNPHLHVTDLRAVGAICAPHGVRWVVDNTFSTPVLTRPISVGTLMSCSARSPPTTPISASAWNTSGRGSARSPMASRAGWRGAACRRSRSGSTANRRMP